MKRIIFLLTILPAFVYGQQLPQEQKNSVTLENEEYLLRKSNEALSKLSDILHQPGDGVYVLKNSSIKFSTTTGSYGIIFQDGTSMVTSSVGAVGVVANPAQFTGNGTASSVLNLLTSTVTLLGPTLEDSEIPNTITLDNIIQITNRSHTNLSEIGTYTHSQIDNQLNTIATDTTTLKTDLNTEITDRQNGDTNLQNQINTLPTLSSTQTWTGLNTFDKLITASSISVSVGYWGNGSNLTGFTDAQIPDDITLTNITQITNRSHTSLSDIGTKTHIQIENQLDTIATDTTTLQASKVSKSGDTMTGQLTLSGSTLTVTGNAFSVGNSTFVVKSGNVGIGTSTIPSDTKFFVTGTETIGIKYQKTNANDARIMNCDTAKCWSMAIGWATAGDFSIIEEGIAGDRLYIKQGGNVGIGTANPTAKLEVNGQIKIVDGTQGTGKLLTSDANGLASWQTVSGDNLGNHIATMTITANYGISASTITASTVTLTGFVNVLSTAGYAMNGYTILRSADNLSGTFVGREAGRVNTGSQNSFLGYAAGYANTAGAQNSFVGYKAGYANTTGSQNSFVGIYAGYNNTTGYYNSFVGTWAGYYNTTGEQNSFLGTYAGYANTTGNYNSFLGYKAGYANTAGNYNSFLGYAAGYYNDAGSGNTIVGSFAGGYGAEPVNSFSSSTIMGYEAGYNLRNSANGNILLGYQAGYNITTGTGNIVIGYGQNAPTATSSNTLNIGGLIYGTGLVSGGSGGNVGIGTTSPQAKLDVAGIVRSGDIMTGQLIASTITTTGNVTIYGTSLTIQNTTPMIAFYGSGYYSPPDYNLKLYYSGVTAYYDAFGSGGHNFDIAGVNKYILGSNKFYSANSVGIGVTNPTYALDVNGVVRSTQMAVGSSMGLETLSCSAGQALGGVTITGGIVSGGSCVSSGGGDAILSATQTFTGQNTFTAQVNISSNLFITDGTQESGKVLTSDANGLASWQDNLGEYTLIYGTYPASQGGEITLSSFSIVIPESFRTNGVILLLEIEGTKMINSGDLVATFNSDYTTTKPLTVHKTYVNTGVAWGITPIDYRSTHFLLTTNDFNTEQRVLIQAIFNYNNSWIMYKCKTVYASSNQYGYTEMGGGYMSNSSPMILTLFRTNSVDYRIYKLQLKAKLK